MNLYVYVLNNPVKYVDPEGLAAKTALDYTAKSVDQLVRGNYTNEVTLLGTGAQIASGFVGLDLPGDIRDITHDIQNWEWSWGHAGKTALDAVGILPVVGSIKYADEIKALTAPKGSVGKYEVGTFDDLKARSMPGDKLDIHHAAQKHPAAQTVEGYDPKTAPSIAVPSREHRRIPTQKGNYTGNARDLLAKDIRDLRNNTNAPNSALQELINLNKTTYPDAFKK